MIAFMLDDTGMEAFGDPVDGRPVVIVSGIMNPGPARHRTAQSGHRETALPAEFALIAKGGDDGVDEDTQIHGDVVFTPGKPLDRDPEQDDPQRNMNLGRR